MRRAFRLFALLIGLAATAAAQNNAPRFAVFGGAPEARGCVRVEFMDNLKRNLLQFAIDYGTPDWKSDYDDPAKFDAMTKGKTWRFGSNFWSRLDSHIPMKIAGTNVPVGIWYLGLRRSADGAQWNLVFIDPEKTRRAAVYDSFMIERAPVEFQVPLTIEKAAEQKTKLTVSLPPQEGSVNRVTLRIQWGSLQLSAPIEVTLPN